MKNIAFLFCFLLAFSACEQDSSKTQAENESDLEEAAAEVYDGASTLGSPEPASPSDAFANADPEETLPGATSTASSSPTGANPLFNYTLQKGQAGAVKIGMPIDEVRQQYGQNKLREIEHQQEGMSSVAYEVLGERSRSDLLVEQKCTGTACTVSRITVLNPAFKTQNGVGIGSTFGEVKNNFSITRVGVGEGNFAAIAENANMSFFLDLGDVPVARWPNLKVKDVPDNAVVTGVLIY